MVSNKVFLDTSFLTSLFIGVDSNHLKATRIWNQLARTKPDLYVSNYIVLEFYTILSQRVGKTKLLEINKGFTTDKINHLHITKELHDNTLRNFQMLTDKNISFVDLSSFIVCNWYKIDTIASLDKHFVQLSKEHEMKLIIG